MDSLIIRALNMNDAPGIQDIHRHCNDAWYNPEECHAWLQKRLESNFYIQAAQLGDKIVGHGELIIDDSPGHRFLYLGMLQVDEDYRSMGIGRKMIDDAVRCAVENNCSEIVTIPDSENTSIIFYEKCGFKRRRLIKSCTLATQNINGFHYKTDIIPAIPQSVISEIPFVFGLAQASSRHMWEVCNRKPVTDDRKTPAMVIDGDSYVQLSYFAENDTGLALLWSRSPSKDDIKSILICIQPRPQICLLQVL
jgi:ribosomal protein S18 acetylase RimI-like enzyme